MKTIWRIEYNSQVLLAGSWGSPDCLWDWELTYEDFKTEEQARRKFATLKPTDDTPLIRLYRINVWLDEEGFAEEAEWVQLEELS